MVIFRFTCGPSLRNCIVHSLGLLGLPADDVGYELALPLLHVLALLLVAHGAHRLADRGAAGDGSTVNSIEEKFREKTGKRGKG